MEWNAKWDWENFVAFGPKATESPKKLQSADWMFVDDGEIHVGSFNISSDGGNSGSHGSSVKSSISASTDSSTKDGIQTPDFKFSKLEGSGNFSEKMEMKGTGLLGTPLTPEASVGSAEQSICLKLGKRTYFENGRSFSVMPTPSMTTLKKTKSSAPVCCQVEGCNTDLSLAKEYHQKHRVCDNHSKCPKVVVGGLERRFCQQCSGFHSLSEFDDKKRSCRRRLSDHNARRRKPQQETVQFYSTRLSSPFYGGTQQMSFLLNNSPLSHSRTPENSKFTLTKGSPLKSNGNGGTDGQLHTPGIKLPHAIYMQNAADALLASKTTTSEVLYPGSKGSSPDAAPEYRRALSLLSKSNSWDACEPESIPLRHPMLENDSSITHHMIHTIPQGVPLSSSGFGQRSTHSHTQSLATNRNFQEIQLSKSPYDADFYPNILN